MLRWIILSPGPPRLRLTPFFKSSVAMELRPRRSISTAGNYNVGGTFEGFIDGNGITTLSNATLAADTVKVGVFGSNGIIDFVSNVTLNISSTAAVIAANTVTIENGVVVTIGGSTPANVYAKVPNYSASTGGNNKTGGTFVGAVTTQPLGGQPPFDSPTRARAATKQSRSISLSR